MKILFTADTHLDLKTHSCKLKTGEDLRTSEIENAFSFIVNRAIEEKVDYFIHGGDLFHTNRPSLGSIVFFHKKLIELNDAGIKFVLIDGNHDAKSDTSSVGPNKIAEIHQKSIFNTPRYYAVDKDLILFVPFPYKIIDSVLDIEKMLGQEKLNAFKNRILITHTTLEGAVTGAESFLLSRGCVVEKAPENWIVFSGHIHKHQIIRKDPIVLYSGSIIQNDFSERNEEKGFIIYETESKECRFIRTPHTKLAQYDVNDIGEVNGKIVKITGMNDTNIDLNELKKKLISLGAISVIIDVKSKKTSAVRSTEMIPERSVSYLFDKYCEVQKLDGDFVAFTRKMIEAL